MDTQMRVEYLVSPEPLVSFHCCLPDAPLPVPEKLHEFFRDKFKPISYFFGSVGELIYHSISSFPPLREGLKFLVQAGLKAATNKIKKGYITVPLPGHNIWQGTRFSFTTVDKLRKAIEQSHQYML